MKRLVVCCDGTWNRPDHIDQGVAAPTNVAKVALALADEDDAGNPQLLHYQAGVGTRRWEHLVGGGFGVGLSRNVQECYRFVVDNYEPGDELYFFGFSRGAFTARSTVGLVRNAGILRPEHRDRIEQAYALYRDPRRDTEPNGIAAQLFRRSYSYDEVYVQFVGVWDTVGALGIPIDGFRPPLLSRLWSFHDTKLSRYVRNAFHAVAIDERRGPFKPTLWDAAARRRGPDARAGLLRRRALRRRRRLPRPRAVGDPAALDGRQRPPLRAGVQARPPRGRRDRSRLRRPPRRAHRRARSAPAQLHDSRTRFYLALPAYDRPLVGTDGGWVGSSAKLRWDEDASYRPPGLGDAVSAGEPKVTPVPDGR